MIDAPIFELKDVGKTYDGGAGTVRALDRVTLTIQRGDYVALMGPSGSGKTTLLNVMGGIDRPSAGEVWFDGQRIDLMTERDLLFIRRGKIAYVFQEPRLLLSLSALENVLLPTAFNRRDLRTVGRRVAFELLAKVGLDHRAHHLPDQLSGGEAQRVCIARTLISGPLVILGDEPTGNLDRKTRMEIVELLERLNSEGHTLVLVTHDTEIGARARRKLMIHDGCITGDSDA